MQRPWSEWSKDMSATKTRNVEMQTDIRYTISAGLTINAVRQCSYRNDTKESSNHFDMALSFNLHVLTL